MTQTNPRLIDADARDRIASDLETTLVVEAAAGTGKTTALVGRILSLLASGAATLASGKSDLLAVTFTEKAAGEMKLRLRAELERARSSATGPTLSRLNQAMQELEGARIETIHSFCAEVLRQYPLEASIDPFFELAADEEQERLYRTAFDDWFAQVLSKPRGEFPGAERVLRGAIRDRNDEGPREALYRAGKSLVSQRDFPTHYEAPSYNRKPAIDHVLSELRALGRIAHKGYKDSFLTKSLLEINRVVFEIDRREETSNERDYDAIEAHFKKVQHARFWNWQGSGIWFHRGDGLTREAVLDWRARVHAELNEVLARTGHGLAAALHRELWGVVQRYEQLKEAEGKLDFLDLLVATKRLLREHEHVRAELATRFGRVLVDEFQDTDPLQAEILFLLCTSQPLSRRDTSSPWDLPVEAGKLFVVGDPKQAIYRFRRADVALYQRITEALVAQGAVVLQLSTSFRSAPSIQAFVNEAFRELMPTEGRAPLSTQATYVPLAPHRHDPPDQPTVIALPVPRPYGGFRKATSFAIDASYPDAVASYIDWLIRSSGWKVTERDDHGKLQAVPLSARHICILFKRLQSHGVDVTYAYAKALESRRISHVLFGGRSFFEREETMAIRSALSAIDWPDDALSVYATLRGPLFAFHDDALLAFRHSQGHLHPLGPRDSTKLTVLTSDVATALDLLGSMHARRNHQPIVQTISELLEATRASAGIAVWPSGEQAIGNILRIIDLARRAEDRASTSFRAFVTKLNTDAVTSNLEHSPVLEDSMDGVRMMTVHKAKGLEFPVVIVADPTAPLTPREPSRHIDAERKLWATSLCGAAPVELTERAEEVKLHDREEAHRLLYVATTRARDLLVLPVLGQGPLEDADDWCRPLAPYLFPEPAAWRKPGVAIGCPPFGSDTVLELPDGAQSRPKNVAPGLHTPERGDHAVVFWDPSALGLEAAEQAGIRHERVLSKGPGSQEIENDHAMWRAKLHQARELAGRPSRSVATVTQRKNTAAEREPGRVALITIERDSSVHHPTGPRFGTLVHAILANAALDAPRQEVVALAQGHGRLVGATAEEISVAASRVSTALEHALFARARSSKRLEREYCIIHTDDGGTLVEGVIDMAFLEPDGTWTIVDFKTDGDLADRLPSYEAQVLAYAQAVSHATRAPAQAVLLHL